MPFNLYNMQLLGPFSQLLPLTDLPLHGALQDEQLIVHTHSGVIVANGKVLAVGEYDQLQKAYPQSRVNKLTTPAVLLPGFIDCHTHICFDGTRSRDYSMRIAGKSYLDIARAGGGIWDSVTRTRDADPYKLILNTVERAKRHLREGVTTIEVKSGYGLNLESELKMLQAIRAAAQQSRATLISTCLAAHICPKDFEGKQEDYLRWIIRELLPAIKTTNLSQRVDIFIEETAFSPAPALEFLKQAAALGFKATVHADQFSSGGSAVAIAAGALSADHLEASTDEDIANLAASDTVAVVLPGASLGLGMQYAPARKLLDAGASLAIASDWNPGSAPMGDLLMQAAVLSAAEKLSSAEVFAGLTTRAAKALGLTDRAVIAPGYVADLQAYPCSDYRDILYYQGKMKPFIVWKNGESIKI
jgi:imidazolonepropionase